MAFHSTIDSVQMYRLGYERKDSAGRIWKYLKGVSSLVAKDAVTFDEAGVTALLAANAKGPVAIAGAATDASTKFGWFCVLGDSVTVNGVANSADNAFVGRETTDGKLGDGRTAGDQIYGMIARSATSGAGDMTVQIFSRPFVDDAYGS